MVNELLDRVVEALRAKGIEPYWIEHLPQQYYWGKQMPERTVHVYQTCRMNHLDQGWENVTVTIEIILWGGNYGKRLLRARVPKDASDKVISNRVDKVIEALRPET